MAVILAGGYMFLGVRLQSGPSSAPTVHSGTITFTPDSISCNRPTDFVERIWLPASVNPSEVMNVRLDHNTEYGALGGIAKFTQMADGSWESVDHRDASTVASECVKPAQFSQLRVPFDLGVHTVEILDMGGRTLAEGSYMVVS
jgi:hypothetical protein